MKRLLLTLFIILTLVLPGLADDLIDSYSETNRNTTLNMSGGVVHGGMTFKSNGESISKVDIYMMGINSPTGNIVARIYTLSGSVGTNAVPNTQVGSDSTTVDSATLNTGDYTIQTFTFSTPVPTTNGVWYGVDIYYPGASGSNYIRLGRDNVTLGVTAPWNEFYNDGSWTPQTNFAITGYYIYGVAAGTSAPILTTQAASDVTDVTGTGNGTITDNGGGTITENGVCIGASANPTTTDTKFTGTVVQSGAFTASMTSLSPGTVYHIRAYAINETGTGYGSDTTFNTLGLPSVTTPAPSSIMKNTATGNGNVTGDGGYTITQRGICIGDSANPTTSGTKFIASGTTGAFTVSMTSLTAAHTYHVRAYAINSVGTSYGDDVAFTTGGRKFFVRPGGSTYGTSDGLSYTNAKAGLNNIPFLAGGDFVYICDDWRLTGIATYQASASVFNATASGGSGVNNITITTDTSDSGDASAIASPGKFAHNALMIPLAAGWTDTGTNGVYSLTLAANAPEPLWEVTSGAAVELNPVLKFFTGDNTPPDAGMLATFNAGDVGMINTDTGPATIYLKPKGGSPDPNNHAYSCSTPQLPTFNLGGFSYYTFRGKGLSGDNYDVYAGFIEVADNSRYITITNWNTKYGRYIAMIDGRGGYVTLTGCNADQCANGVYGIHETVGNPSNNTVSYCNFSNMDSTHRFNTDTDNHGISFQGGLNNVMHHCTFDNCGSGPFIYSGYAADLSFDVYDCYILNSNANSANHHGVGIGLELSASHSGGIIGHIYNNIIVGGGLLVGEPQSGHGIYVNPPSPAWSNTEALLIVNNTVYNTPGVGIRLYGFQASSPLWAIVKNNIVHTAGTYLAAIWSTADLSTWNLDMDYNDFYPGSVSTPFFYGGATNWATWKALTIGGVHPDAHSITTDPLFINAGGSYALATDFKLQALSPCINTGTNTGITTDYEGAARPQ